MVHNADDGSVTSVPVGAQRMYAGCRKSLGTMPTSPLSSPTHQPWMLYSWNKSEQINSRECPRATGASKHNRIKYQSPFFFFLSDTAGLPCLIIWNVRTHSDDLNSNYEWPWYLIAANLAIKRWLKMCLYWINSDDRGESRWVENLAASDILADATTICSRVLIPKWRENSKQDKTYLNYNRLLFQDLLQHNFTSAL